MLQVDGYRTKIKVNKEPGVYSFEPLSSTGKTYLCETCKRLHDCGANIAGYDFRDYKNCLPLPKDVDLLVVDRYERYPVLDDELKELAQKSIVLVDIKTDPFPDVCAVEFTADGDFLVY